MPREANEERKHNYEESIDYDSHYDEYRNGELQRDAGDYQREPVCAERGYIGRHPKQNGRDLRCLEEMKIYLVLSPSAADTSSGGAV